MPIQADRQSGRANMLKDGAESRLNFLLPKMANERRTEKCRKGKRNSKKTNRNCNLLND